MSVFFLASIPSFTYESETGAAMIQIELLRKEKKSYGGVLLSTRKGRSGPRPLSIRETMHLVLRSSKAHGEWSFRHPRNERKIKEIIEKFALKYGVKILSLANVGNHLHFHIKLSNRHAYKPFIRAITSAIAMAVTGVSRWRKMTKEKFWDYRPFTRIVQGFRAFLNLKDYIRINEFEGLGCSRVQARFILAAMDRQGAWNNSA